MHFSQSKIVKIISVFLLAVVFFTTTGFTLHKHICHCNNEIVFSFFPEVFGLKKSCCCAEIDKINDSKINYNQFLSNPDCCKNVFLFYKLPAFNVVVDSIIKKINFQALTLVTKDYSLIYTTQNTKPLTSVYRPPPLILSGQSLIHFIHNLKIPLPEMDDLFIV
jgi:hypothetical protein